MGESGKLPNERLREARERAGKQPDEAAYAAGINTPSYYDLEAHAGEITMNLSLRELKNLCEFLNISSHELFGAEPPQMRITAVDLKNLVQDHIRTRGISLGAFEDRVGFSIKDILSQPEALLDWNVDCLRSVSREIGIQWLHALP